MNQPSIGPGLDDHCSDGEVFLAVGIFRFSQCPEFWGEHFPFVKKYLCGNSFALWVLVGYYTSVLKWSFEEFSWPTYFSSVVRWLVAHCLKFAWRCGSKHLPKQNPPSKPPLPSKQASEGIVSQSSNWSAVAEKLKLWNFLW